MDDMAMKNMALYMGLIKQIDDQMGVLLVSESSGTDGRYDDCYHPRSGGRPEIIGWGKDLFSPSG